MIQETFRRSPAALNDVRVLDMTRMLAGPSLTQMLGDLGADVIKVERPRVGDDQRRNSPVFLKDATGNNSAESAYFLSVNRNKRGVEIDFSKPAGQDLVRRLAALCDVFVENYKVGTLERYGLDYAALRAVNSRLVYCSVTGFGQSGPSAAYPGYDPVFQAQSGLMSITGLPDGVPGGGPMKVGSSISDWLGGLNGAIGVLAALHERQRSGEGQHIDIALLDCTLASMGPRVQEYLINGQVAGRHGLGFAIGGPAGAYACADGQIMLSVGNDGQYRKLCDVLGRPALADDPRYADAHARRTNKELLDLEISSLFAGLRVQDIVKTLMEADIPAAPINDIRQALEDPQIVHRGMAVPLPHPLTGELRFVANPVGLQRTPPIYDLPPPMLGQHTAAVLKELLGVNAAALEGYREQGVI